MVSAHQSIGCGAISLFGTPEQKQRYLPPMSKEMLSAFCLSEPNVGCDAAAQETHCELTDDGENYILNGEKKWATSAAMAGLFTVMAKQKLQDPETGKETERITALICTPDMEGIDIFSRNRAKCGIRGTWQARIRFTNVRVPKENLLHKEGKGLNVALTCLNYGRCTLSAGMVGASRVAMEQGIKWAKYRYQFDRPIGEFELMQGKLADMYAGISACRAYVYAVARALDQGAATRKDAAGAILYAAEKATWMAGQAIQALGGNGYINDYPAGRLLRDAKLYEIGAGTSEVRRMLIGRELFRETG